MRLWSYRNRPVHLGPYPLERLKRTAAMPDLSQVPAVRPLAYRRDGDPFSLVHAMRRYAAMLDAIRDGLVKREAALIPDDPAERARHLKAFGYFQDASQVGACELAPSLLLAEPIVNADIEALSRDLRTQQTKTLAAGIDLVMAELKESMEAPPRRIDHHTHCLVFLCEYPRDPKPDEPGGAWIQDCQVHRAAVRAAETVAVLANYIRLLGYEARAHTPSATDIDLNRAAVACGLAEPRMSSTGTQLGNPYLGTRFGLAAITTTLALAPDEPLGPRGVIDRLRSHGPAWWVGRGFAKSACNRTSYKRRRFRDGPYPFERTRRTDAPTTLVDEPRIPRVPKRTDMFARAVFGDMGKSVQEGARNGNYVRKSPASFAHRRALGAFVLLQDRPAADAVGAEAADPARNAERVKAALHYLGADAVGISRCPDWTYYSHDAAGEPIAPYHANAINVIVDQGHETMEGASGDDWIACAQSMRAYLRFSLLGGIVAEQIRRLGYTARVHTVVDGEVLQPPLLLLSGLGEVSRIGEVILNPYLGPRLKSGTITTNLPLAHDRPIDFGLQHFCSHCNKCARECPSGAITAGGKRMFNGYEIWKSDSQKCTTYRVTQLGGAMCGRCMKTCPWNLEGLFGEAPFRWAASRVPRLARHLAALDDKLKRGSINPVKKWWWDLEMRNEGPYRPAERPAHRRTLQPELKLVPAEQTLAVYPANLAPHPYPFPFRMDREAGIRAHEALVTPNEYRRRLANGDVEPIAHQYTLPEGPVPVLALRITDVERMTDDIAKYKLAAIDGAPLPPFGAGAHIDMVVAPEYLRQYSLCGDPADRSAYEVAILREAGGRGGSALAHRVFAKGRRVFVSRPIQHFPLVEDARRTLLLGGGIGITPLLAMAHRLHALGRAFELHYSVRDRSATAFLRDLEAFPWRKRVHLHVTSENSRLDPDAILNEYADGSHLYTCGPERYLAAVLAAAATHGWPEAAVHTEYFSTPEVGEYENHPFTIRLAASNRRIAVPADKSAAIALIEHGIPIDMKCEDGLCGVCKRKVLGGDVEHRDFVLSSAQRRESMITCQSRARESGGEIVLDA